MAGIAALIWSRNGFLNNFRVRDVLQGTGDNIDASNPGLVGMFGRGRIIALCAVCHPTRGVANFGHDGAGPRVEKHARFRENLTGDRRADIVGFGDAGVRASLS